MTPNKLAVYFVADMVLADMVAPPAKWPRRLWPNIVDLLYLLWLLPEP